ncbi:MAG TPA: tRNA pseudouridine(55) synthase TruB [Candidatus Binatia bacterium]|nr:tRNA pseudouridine(55) synthase TruB [Candidatus Binatia bacterium]
MRSGILLIDKPEGPSSAQIVHKAKVSLGARKVGHLGTLDPFASGLLLLGIEEGTKIADVFLSASKSYRGVMVLGVSTDSQDATGKVLETRPVPALDGARLARLAQQFTGDLEQVPPMFSALKKDGVRLYRLARQGQEIARAARAVRVESLTLRQLGAAEIELDVTCSSGTYVRTLAADMGAVLRCGAHLKSLRRLSCGPWTIDKAVTLEALERPRAISDQAFLPLAAALGHIPSVTWDHRWIARLRMGQQEVLGQLTRPLARENLLRVLDTRGNLVALAQWSEAGWRLARVFRE